MPSPRTRIHVDRNGVVTIVEHCIECPNMSTCSILVLNDRPASGPVPQRCKLQRRAASDK